VPPQHQRHPSVERDPALEPQAFRIGRERRIALDGWMTLVLRRH